MSKFQEVNKTLSVFNEFSAKRFNDTSKDFEKHIKMLVTMKSDLDLIFRRIRSSSFLPSYTVIPPLLLWPTMAFAYSLL